MGINDVTGRGRAFFFKENNLIVTKLFIEYRPCTYLSHPKYSHDKNYISSNGFLRITQTFEKETSEKTMYGMNLTPYERNWQK